MKSFHLVWARTNFSLSGAHEKWVTSCPINFVQGHVCFTSRTAGFCVSPRSSPGSKAKNILDSHRTPYSLGNSQLLPPLLPLKQSHTFCTSALGQEDLLEKEMTTLSSILAWRIPWTKEPGGLQFMGSQRVEHDWVTCFLVSGLHGDRALVEGLSYKQGGRWGDDPSLWDGIQSGQEPMVQTAEDPVSCFPLPMTAGVLFLSWLISSLSRENERRKMEEKLIAQVKDLVGKEFNANEPSEISVAASTPWSLWGT